MTDESTVADEVVGALRGALGDGKHGLGVFPKLLKRVLREGLWKERVIQKTRQHVEFERFEKFISTPPLEGLGADIGLIRNLIRDDVEALEMFDAAVQGKHGGDHKSEAINFDNVQVGAAPTGNSKQAAIRRLRKQRPDLLEKVKAGEMSAHAAAREAGFRKERSPLSWLRWAWKKASEAERESFLDEVNG